MSSGGWVELCGAEEAIARVNGAEDHFQTLGVARDADAKVIKDAYRKLALKLHPDKCSEEGASDAFKKVAAAFSCLRDPDSREYYTKFGREQGEHGVSPFRGDPNELYREMFEAMMRAQAEAQGMDNTGGAFHFHAGGSSAQFTMNGQSFGSFLPPWLRKLIELVPPQIRALLFFGILIFTAMYVFEFVFRNAAILLAIGIFGPEGHKGKCFGIVFLLYALGWVPSGYLPNQMP